MRQWPWGSNRHKDPTVPSRLIPQRCPAKHGALEDLWSWCPVNNLEGSPSLSSTWRCVSPAVAMQDHLFCSPGTVESAADTPMKDCSFDSPVKECPSSSPDVQIYDHAAPSSVRRQSVPGTGGWCLRTGLSAEVAPGCSRETWHPHDGCLLMWTSRTALHQCAAAFDARTVCCSNLRRIRASCLRQGHSRPSQVKFIFRTARFFRIIGGAANKIYVVVAVVSMPAFCPTIFPWQGIFVWPFTTVIKKTDAQSLSFPRGRDVTDRPNVSVGRAVFDRPRLKETDRYWRNSAVVRTVPACTHTLVTACCNRPTYRGTRWWMTPRRVHVTDVCSGPVGPWYRAIFRPAVAPGDLWPCVRSGHGWAVGRAPLPLPARDALIPRRPPGQNWLTLVDPNRRRRRRRRRPAGESAAPGPAASGQAPPRDAGRPPTANRRLPLTRAACRPCPEAALVHFPTCPEAARSCPEAALILIELPGDLPEAALKSPWRSFGDKCSAVGWQTQTGAGMRMREVWWKRAYHAFLGAETRSENFNYVFVQLLHDEDKRTWLGSRLIRRCRKGVVCMVHYSTMPNSRVFGRPSYTCCCHLLFGGIIVSVF